MAMQPKRRRVSAEANLATASAGNSKITYLTLPKGYTLWTGPDAADSFDIDFVPYVIESDTHPDRKTVMGVEHYVPGDVWYRHLYKVHSRVGPNFEDLVCPTTFANSCPICEYVQDLRKEYEANKVEIGQTKAKEQGLYIVKNPKKPKEFCLWPYSMFKFGDYFDNEIRSTSADNRFFYEGSENGRTVTARFFADSYGGRSFWKCNRIDFKKRPEFDEDVYFKTSICLDNLFDVKSYDQISKLFYQAGSSANQGQSTAPSGNRPASTSGTSGGKTTTPKTAKQTPPDSEPETDSTDRGEGILAFHDGDKVSFKDEGKQWTGTVIAIDEKTDNLSVKRSDGKERDKDFTLCTLLEAAEASKGSDEGQSAPEPEKPAKTTRKAPAKETAKAKTGPFEIGQTIQDPDGEQGEITEIDSDGDLTVKNKNGKAWMVLPETATLVETEDGGEAGNEDESGSNWNVGDRVSYTMKVTGKSKEFTGKIIKVDASTEDAKIKADTGESHNKDFSELTKVEADDTPAELEAGQTVTWKDGKAKKTGELIKLKDDDAWKVRDDAGESHWIEVGKLTLAE